MFKLIYRKLRAQPVKFGLWASYDHNCCLQIKENVTFVGLGGKFDPPSINVAPRLRKTLRL